MPKKPKRTSSIQFQPKKVTDCIVLILIISLVSFIIILMSYFTYSSESAGLANPAAVFCVNRGYTYDLDTGNCMFPDNSECPGFNYLRGECVPITDLISDERPGVLSISEVLESPVYDTLLSVYGEVRFLGELFCPCFSLTSDGHGVEVWYDMMVEDNGTARTAVNVSGLNNGNWVIVTGELKQTGTYSELNGFWAQSIEIIRSN